MHCDKKEKRNAHILKMIVPFLVVICLLISAMPKCVYAASSSEIRKQIDKLKIEKEEIQSQIEEIKQQYQENKNEIYELVNKKNLIDREIGLLHAEIDNINNLITAYSSLIADRQDELDAVTERYNKLNKENKIRIRAIEEGGTINYWEVVFRATSFTNLLDNLAMMEEIAESDNKRLKEMSEAAALVEETQKELIVEKEEQEKAKQELNLKQSELDTKRQEADEILQELILRGAEMEELQSELEKEDESLLAQIAEMELEYTRAKEEEYLAWLAWQAAQEALKQQEAEREQAANNNGTSGSTDSSASSNDQNNTTPSNPTPPSESINVGNSWIRPCNYVKLTSPYGQRVSPTTGASTNHSGVDLSAPAGTPIYASRGGTVTIARWSDSAGYYVTINHGDGFSSIYMHMTNFIVAAGQKVNQGQTIGYVGSTGISTGNHLHFGIMYGGGYVNPCSYAPIY